MITFRYEGHFISGYFYGIYPDGNGDLFYDEKIFDNSNQLFLKIKFGFFTSYNGYKEKIISTPALIINNININPTYASTYNQNYEIKDKNKWKLRILNVCYHRYNKTNPSSCLVECEFLIEDPTGAIRYCIPQHLGHDFEFLGSYSDKYIISSFLKKIFLEIIPFFFKVSSISTWREYEEGVPISTDILINGSYQLSGW